MNREDVERRLETHLQEAERAMLTSLRGAVGRASAEGTLQSGRHLKDQAQLVGDALDQFVTAATGDVSAVELHGDLLDVLYGIATTKLIQLKLRGAEHLNTKSAEAGPSASAVVEAELERRLASARTRLLDHQAGFGREGIRPATSFRIEAAAGAVVQAYSPGAVAHTAVNIVGIRAALDELERAIDWDTLSAEHVSDM